MKKRIIALLSFALVSVLAQAFFLLETPLILLFNCAVLLAILAGSYVVVFQWFVPSTQSPAVSCVWLKMIFLLFVMRIMSPRWKSCSVQLTP